MKKQKGNIISKFFRRFVLILIKIYQNTLSLDHGPLRFLRPHGQCKFYPTCSEYTYQAIDRYGIIKGGIKGIRRIGRCHPWSDGGIDQVK